MNYQEKSSETNILCTFYAALKVIYVRLPPDFV